MTLGSSNGSSATTLVGTGLSAVLGGRTVFAGVDIDVAPRAVTCLVGPNGEGKTTLMRVLAGIARPSSGAVHFGGEDLFALPPRERARRVGALFAAPDTTFGFTVRELVEMGRYPHLGRAFEGEADREATEHAMAELELVALADQPIHTLSTGERQRVGIARLLCQAPSTYLFDEPTSNLDPAHIERFVQVARKTAKTGAGVLCVVHDLDLALRLADQVVVLHAGRVHVRGAPAEVLTPEVVEVVWGVGALRVDPLAGRPSLVMKGGASTGSPF
jgi:iron complex transport system ATP-binding protein